MDDGTNAAGRSARADGWGRAVAQAGVVLGCAVLGFAVVPDRLVAWLSPRISPVVRDLLVSGWVVAWFVLLARGFVALQKGRGG